jgi:uncharacterized protein (TIGR04255 family)
MTKPLPIKLGHEPIVAAALELRGIGAVPLHTVLPGVFRSAFAGEELATTPVQPNEVMVPLGQSGPKLRLAWRGYDILVGDDLISMNIGLKYPGWTQYRADALVAIAAVIDQGALSSLFRYGIKYVNFFEKKTPLKDILNWSLQLGSNLISEENLQLRVERQVGELRSIVAVVTEAIVRKGGSADRAGCILDIDTVCLVPNVDIQEFRASLGERLDAVRLLNKQVFFDLITEQQLATLEPTYA